MLDSHSWRRLVAVGILLFGFALLPVAARAEEATPSGSVAPTFPMYFGIGVVPIRGETLVEGNGSKVVIDAVLQGDQVKHAFLIRNDGPVPIELMNVSACDGCILEDYTKEIAPGATGRISIKIITDAKGGQRVVGTVRAETSDPERPDIVIDVALTVAEFALLDPYHVELKGSLGETIVARCVVVPNDDYPFEVTGIKARNGASFELSRREITRRGRPAYEITLTNTRTRPGSFEDELFIQTTNPSRPELKVRVEGRIEPAS